MTSKEALDIIKQRINTIRLNTKIGSRTIADKENAVLLGHIEYNLNQLCELVERDTPAKVIKTQNWSYHCPKCKNEIDVSNVGFDTKQVYRYCYYCGQRLDWSKL
jgi:DNA-directed RNA polymerase subunit RPC12/RpoP